MIRDDAMRKKHRERVIEMIASERCSTDLTDGFCGPRDGKCRYDGKSYRRDCMAQARSIMLSIESRGVRVVWIYDPAITEDINIRAEREHD